MTDRAFTAREARNEARQYRRRGPAGQTREILSAIRSFGLKDVTLLDVGGGIGAIHHELLQDVAETAVHVDASSAYLKEARAETARRGHAGRVTFVHADFTDVASGLAEAAIVTLDRVVCCYPDYDGLLKAAAGRARRLLVMTYPRETWYLRLGLAIINSFLGFRREPFRTYLHPVREMERVLNAEGMYRVSTKRLFVWELALYSREGPHCG
ncbi:MAG: class I SAM-dependent methyltransferase [Chloroflexota bacterium]